MIPDFEVIQAEKAKRRLREYVRQAWPLVEPATVFVPSFQTDAVADHLEAVARRQIRHLVINIPPRHSKSLYTCVFFPTWTWIDPYYGRDKDRPAAPSRGPNVRFLCASYAQPLSLRDAVKSRRLLDSAWYQSRWGDHFRLTSDQNEKGRYENDKAGYRIATSVGGTVTGEGGDVLIIDDPAKADEAESDTVRQGINDWFDQAWSTRLNDPNASAMVVIMQRLHETDLTGHLMDKGGWTFLILPTEYTRSVYVRASGFRYDPTAYKTEIGFQDPRTDEGQLLNPDRFGPEAVEQARRDLGAYGYAGQHSQRPAPAEGGRIKRVWFRYWHRPGTNPGPVPVRTADGLIMVPSVELPTATAEELAKNPQAPWDEILQTWDMSFKDKERRGRGGDVDFVAGGVLARKAADKFLLDLAHDRMDFPVTLTTVRGMCGKWPQVYTKLVEDKANGSAVIDSLQHEIGGFIAIEPMGGKPARVAAASPQIESGNVYLPHPAQCSWTEKLILECITFPNAAHDDLVDMLTQGLIRMQHAKVQVYAFDSAGKMIAGEERTLTPDQRFLLGLNPADPIPEPSDEKPKDPRDGMTPEQRYELGLD